MGKSWIQSWSGKQLMPAALTKEMVGGVDEIAHALSLKCRFTGQCPEFYSVAQHCVIGATLLPQAYAGAFLLHELSEVYLPDIASPLKPLVFLYVDTEQLRATSPELVEASDDSGRYTTKIPWTALEAQHTKVILDALGLASIEPLIYSPEIKRMDLAMLAAEKRDFFPKEPEDWKLPEPPAPCDTIKSLTPRDAQWLFTQAFERYFK